MLRLFQRTFLALTVAGAATSAPAFSLLGPFDTFQTVAIGYNPYGNDVGGPMNLGQGYRWNIKTITYAFDPSFMHYFGVKGSNAVMQAINIINALPPMSKTSASLSEYPTDTTKQNVLAQTLGILDVKSETLAVLLNELGLTSSERYVWCLRGKTTIAPNTFNYLVIQRNFDPVTGVPSMFVNGVLYTYAIVDPIPLAAGSYADAIEIPVDPDAPSFTSVVSAADLHEGSDTGLLLREFNAGEFFTGLTRDDVGGLRYLYVNSKANRYVETLPPTATATSSGGSAWSPVEGTGGTNTTTGTTGGTGGTTTTTAVSVNSALRPGIDKINLVPVTFDSTFGGFVTTTNIYVDSYITNGVVAKQSVQRVLATPDILFTVADLPLDAGGNPGESSRSTPIFANNAALNTLSGPTAGPGQINPSAIITFSDLGPFVENQNPSFLDQANLSEVGPTWGSFDGTTNAPTVFPQGLTIQDLQQFLLVSP